MSKMDFDSQFKQRLSTFCKSACIGSVSTGRVYELMDEPLPESFKLLADLCRNHHMNLNYLFTGDE